MKLLHKSAVFSLQPEDHSRYYSDRYRPQFRSTPKLVFTWSLRNAAEKVMNLLTGVKHRGAKAAELQVYDCTGKYISY